MTEGEAVGAAKVGSGVTLGVCAEAKLTWGSKDDVLAARLLLSSCTGLGRGVSAGLGAGPVAGAGRRAEPGAGPAPGSRAGPGAG